MRFVIFWLCFWGSCSLGIKQGVRGREFEFERLLLVDRGHFAKCLDGSSAGYYLRKAKQDRGKNNTWVIWLQGGGLCVTPFDCLYRSTTERGSSKEWPAISRFGKIGFLSDDPRVNPWYFANRVYLPYCSGDLWIGKSEEKNGKLGDVYQQGHLILQETIHDLFASEGLDKAGHVILAGESAGGYGTIQHADWLSDLIHKELNLSSVNVAAIPVAGYFFPKDVSLFYPFALGHPFPFINIAKRFVPFMLTDFYVNEDCLKGKNVKSDCWDIDIVSWYVKKTRLLYLQNKFDMQHIYDDLLCPKSICNENPHSSVGRRFLADCGRKLYQSFEKKINSGTTATTITSITKDEITNSDSNIFIDEESSSSSPIIDINNNIEEISSSSLLSHTFSFFSPSCFQHDANFSFLEARKIDSVSLLEVLSKWFYLQKDFSVFDKCDMVDNENEFISEGGGGGGDVVAGSGGGGNVDENEKKEGIPCNAHCVEGIRYGDELPFDLFAFFKQHGFPEIQNDDFEQIAHDIDFYPQKN